MRRQDRDLQPWSSQPDFRCSLNGLSNIGDGDGSGFREVVAVCVCGMEEEKGQRLFISMASPQWKGAPAVADRRRGVGDGHDDRRVLLRSTSTSLYCDSTVQFTNRLYR